jgi:hypothetical protein
MKLHNKSELPEDVTSFVTFFTKKRLIICERLLITPANSQNQETKTSITFLIYHALRELVINCEANLDIRSLEI